MPLPSRPTGRRRLSLTSLLAASALAVTALSATSSPALAAEGGPGKTAGDTARRVVAERALSRVERIFDGSATGRDATLALRDLALMQDSLTPEDRKAAADYLARPSDPDGGVTGDPEYGDEPMGTACGDAVCVHWVEGGVHAVAEDGDVDTRPQWVTTTLEVLEHVAGTYLEAGYRPAKSDGVLGGNGLADVYLADVGDEGTYGYCTSDQPQTPGVYDVWAFCVLDEDFSEFSNTELESLQVTAAHEYFHAIQFGYDRGEDPWLLEATATWAEDELYPDVEDNLQYLDDGPLGRPDIPLDRFGGSHHYGDWIFLRFLTERITASTGGLPDLVREIWERADAAPGAPFGDQYSVEAVAGALEARGIDFADAFAVFSDANRYPALSYREGAANGYPTAPLRRFGSSNGWSTTKLDHLTSATGTIAPRRGFKRLKVIVDLAPVSRGSRAIATVHWKSGEVTPAFVTLNGEGNGSRTVAFDSRVRRVEVTLVNASRRMASCWNNTPFACGGYSADDRLPAKVRVVTLR